MACLAACFFLAAALPLSAGQFIIDQKHPQASDDNPGTLDKPWKTIAKAGKTLQAGDTARVKAGRYREGLIHFANNGRRIPVDDETYIIDGPAKGHQFQPITLEAFGDGEVILDGSVELPTEGWSLVDGRKNVYVSKVSAHGWPNDPLAHQIFWVFADGKSVMPKVGVPGATGGNGPLYKPVLTIPGDDDAMTFYHDIPQGLLYVNLGGRSPKQAGPIEASVWPMAIQAYLNEGLVLRGLSFQRYSSRTIDFTRARDSAIFDCLLRNCGGLTCGENSVVRRNTIIDDTLVAVAPGSSSMVDENLVIRNFRDVTQTRNLYNATAITYFGQDFIRFRNNVVMESPGNGFWPDCPSNGHVHYGNSIYNCKANAFYIECPTFQSSLYNNVCVGNQNGIYLRQNASNTIAENYISGSSSGIAMGCTDNVYYEMRNNQVTGNWVEKCTVGVGAGPGPGGKRQDLSMTDRNVFDPSVATIAVWGGQPYKTLDEFRKGTGNEPHGMVQKVDRSKLGLVSFRVAESSQPWQRCYMFGNPHMHRPNWGACTDYPYFWKLGTMQQWDFCRWRSVNDLSVPVTPADDKAGGIIRDTMDTCYWVARNADEIKAIAQRQTDPDDVAVLEVKNAPDKAIWDQGLGFWSASLPTAGGAKVDLRLHAILRDVKATANGGGLVFFAEWSDYTRAKVERHYLVGLDDRNKVHQEKLVSGTYDYTAIEGQVVAPDWARRFRVFFGLRSCTGIAAFDDFDRMEVDEGVAPPHQPEAEVQEAQPKPLVDARTLEFFTVDLSKHVNRSLRDEKADDGEGGWTDQGPGADMNNLTPGKKEYQGVPFDLLQPNTCVVLKALQCRPQSKDLPAKVTIDVGRKADVLYFLHDTAWCIEDAEVFRYVIHYDDNMELKLPIIGGQHIWDWTAGYQAKFTKKLQGMRPSVAQTLGGGAVFPQVNVYMLEWLNPNPNKAIKSVEFISDDCSVPILLGITGGKTRSGK
jgi:parallel beta-helix repeat protein